MMLLFAVEIIFFAYFFLNKNDKEIREISGFKTKIGNDQMVMIGVDQIGSG